MKARFLAAGLLLMAAAAPAAAQAGGDPAMAAEVMEEREQRPFDLLLQARYELGLTADQVTRLQAIAARLDETNRPLRAELAQRWAEVREQRRQELLRMSPAERRAELRRIRELGPPPVPESMRPLVQRVRQNLGAAMREAGSVLTPAQKARVRELVRRQERGRMGPGGRRGGGRMGGGLPRGRP